MPRKPKKPSEPPIASKSPSPAPAPIRSSGRRPTPSQKTVAFADTGAPVPGSTRKPVRLRWGPEMPDNGVKQRVAIAKAEKALQAAQSGAQKTAKAVEKENAQRAEQERQAEERRAEEQRHEEEEEEEEEETEGNDTGNTNDELDRQEEENLEYNQEIPYEYTVSWALKGLYRPSPNPRKAVKWTGKIGEDWVQGQFKYNTLDLELTNAMEQLAFDSLVEVIVSVKSTNTWGTRKLLTFEELSQEG